jgi:hypothetical protein
MNIGILVAIILISAIEWTGTRELSNRIPSKTYIMLMEQVAATLYICILEIPVSNFGRITGSPPCVYNKKQEGVVLTTALVAPIGFTARKEFPVHIVLGSV